MLEILRLSEDMTLLPWFCAAWGTFCGMAKGIFHACTIVCLSHSQQQRIHSSILGMYYRESNTTYLTDEIEINIL